MRAPRARLISSRGQGARIGGQSFCSITSVDLMTTVTASPVLSAHQRALCLAGERNPVGCGRSVADQSVRTAGAGLACTGHCKHPRISPDDATEWFAGGYCRNDPLDLACVEVSGALYVPLRSQGG